MATFIAGTTAAQRARNTRNTITGATIPLQAYAISRRIYTKNARWAPFCVLLENIGSEPSHDDTYRWKEDELVPQTDTLSGSVIVGATALTVVNVRKWTVNDVVYVHSYNAQGLVTLITPGAGTAGVLTISWVVAPTAALLPNTQLVRIGNAHEQVSIHEIGPSTIAVDHSNVYQDFRHGCACSIQHYNGKFQFDPADWKHQMDKKRSEHEREKEKTAIFGQTALWQTGASPRGFERGIYYDCVTNRTNVGTVALTRTALDNFLLAVMQRNEQEAQNWWLISSGRIHSQISQFANPLERTDTSADQFGMGVSRYKTPLGEIVKIITHPMFFQHGWHDLALLVNMSRENIYGVFHRNMATKMHRSIQPYGRSAIEEFYWTVMTMCLKGEDINLGVLEGVAAA